MLIEVQTSKNGEEQAFRDIYLEDLPNQSGELINSIIRNSNKPDTVTIWVSDDNDVDKIYESTVSTEIEAKDILQLLEEIKKDYA